MPPATAASPLGLDLTPRKLKALEAVLDYAKVQGFAYRSLREVAQGTGISHRMLIYHFGSQEGLWRAVLNHVRHLERRRYAAESVYCGDAAQLRRYLWDQWRRYSSEDYLAFFRLFFELYGYALSDPAKHKDFLADVIEPWLDHIGALLRQTGIGRAEASARARLLLAGGRGLLLDLLTTGARKPVERSFKRLIEAVTA